MAFGHAEGLRIYSFRHEQAVAMAAQALWGAIIPSDEASPESNHSG